MKNITASNIYQSCSERGGNELSSTMLTSHNSTIGLFDWTQFEELLPAKQEMICIDAILIQTRNG